MRTHNKNVAKTMFNLCIFGNYLKKRGKKRLDRNALRCKKGNVTDIKLMKKKLYFPYLKLNTHNVIEIVID